jgi:hypothetical protein
MCTNSSFMKGYYSKLIIYIYLIFCHISLKITTLENPQTYKTLNIRKNRNKTNLLQIIQIVTIISGGNPYILW